MTLVSGGLILFGINVELRLYSMKTRLLLKKTQIYEHGFGEKNDICFIECNAEIAQKGGPSDTYPALQDAILEFGERSWSLVDESTPLPISKTLVMVQSDPTRTPTQLIRIDVR